jgi:hypothetical protein
LNNRTSDVKEILMLIRWIQATGMDEEFQSRDSLLRAGATDARRGALGRKVSELEGDVSPAVSALATLLDEARWADGLVKSVHRVQLADERKATPRTSHEVQGISFGQKTAETGKALKVDLVGMVLPAGDILTKKVEGLDVSLAEKLPGFLVPAFANVLPQ